MVTGISIEMNGPTALKGISICGNATWSPVSPGPTSLNEFGPSSYPTRLPYFFPISDTDAPSNKPTGVNDVGGVSQIPTSVSVSTGPTNDGYYFPIAPPVRSESPTQYQETLSPSVDGHPSTPTSAPTEQGYYFPIAAPSTDQPSTTPGISTSLSPSYSPVDMCNPIETSLNESLGIRGLELAIVEYSGGRVSFSISQSQAFSDDLPPEWISTRYAIGGGQVRCDTEFGVVGRQFTYTASCAGEQANVMIYAENPDSSIVASANVPEFCFVPSSVDYVSMHTFTLPCECAEPPSVAPTPSPAPTKVCDYYDLTFDSSDIGRGDLVSSQWEDLGSSVSGAGSLTVNGGSDDVIIFDSSEPVDPNGNGTPSLGGDFGNLLVLQDPTASLDDHWKASEFGGTLSFEFGTPADEISELGLVTGVDEVWIQVTGAQTDGETPGLHTFVIPEGEESSYTSVLLDVPNVSQIDVVAEGPVGIANLEFCGHKKSVTPSTAPVELTSSTPTSSQSSITTDEPSTSGSTIIRSREPVSYTHLRAHETSLSRMPSSA